MLFGSLWLQGDTTVAQPKCAKRHHKACNEKFISLLQGLMNVNNCINHVIPS